MKKIIFIIVTSIMLLSLYSCNPTEPGEGTSSWLSVDDVSCTESWLKVSGSPNNATVSIKRDGKEIYSFLQPRQDSVIYDATLEPGKTYSYQASRFYGGTTSEKSPAITATMLDTTSHDFTWQSYVVGDALSSMLSDVVIINDTLMYAVGTIYPRYDHSMLSYTYAQWDGHDWTLKRLYRKQSDGTLSTPLQDIRCIQEINPNDIWLATGNLFHWTAIDSIAELRLAYYELSKPTSSAFFTVWANTDDDVYGAGMNGTLVHVNSAGSWKEIDSKTKNDINNIYGSYNNLTNKQEILAVASSLGSSFYSDIIQIDGNSSMSLSTQGIGMGNLLSVWHVPNRAYYVAGGALYFKHKLTDSSWIKCDNAMRYYSTMVCGNNINDVFAVSPFGDIVHYNGRSWKNYYMQTQVPDCGYSKIKAKGNIVVATGYNGRDVVIVVGKRQH